MSALCKVDKDVLDECEEITKELQNGREDYQYLWKKIYDLSIVEIDDIQNVIGVVSLHPLIDTCQIGSRIERCPIGFFQDERWHFFIIGLFLD